jgi:aminoglycoside phosphotransferase (APT) family kinase protein
LFLEKYPFSEAEHEARITDAAHKAGLPVPAVKEVMKVEGRGGIVFERVEGPIMGKAVSSKPWKLSHYARMLAELHARMHSYEIPGLPSQREYLKMIIRDRVSLPGDSKEALLAVLEQLPDGNALCHNDFHPDNIIISVRGPVIIDWQTAKRGNPMADVARTSLILRVGTPPGVGAVSRRLMLLGSSLLNSIYLKRYAQVGLFSPEEMNKWLPVLAAARLAEPIPEEKETLLEIMEAGLASQ